MVTKEDRIRSDFNKISSIVCKYFNVDEEDFIKSNNNACVDARYLIVYKLCDIYKDKEIANAIGLSSKCVNKVRNNFALRLKDKNFKNDYNFIMESML